MTNLYGHGLRVFSGGTDLLALLAHLVRAEQPPATEKALRRKVAGAGSWKSGWYKLNC